MSIGLLRAGALYCLYLALSLADPWGHVSPMVQLVFYGGVFLLMIGSILAGLLGRPTGQLRVSAKWALLAVVLTGISAMMAGPDRTRLLEIAVKPRALFSYPVPEITVTVIPPGYSGREAFTERLPLEEELSSGLTPVPEGSEIRVQMTHTNYAAMVIAGHQKIPFLQAAAEAGQDKGFVARFIVEDEISWRIMEGSRRIGVWPIMILEDEAPVVARADFRKLETTDGLFGVSLDLTDDYEVERVSVGVVPAGEAPEKMQDRITLPVSQVTEFSGDFYLNLSASDLAGQLVDLVVEAEDQAGQKNYKVMGNVTLPEKIFSNPSARQIMEVRQGIKDDPDQREKFARRLMALGLVPDNGATSSIYYMAVRSAYRRLKEPREEADIEGALDILWDLANSLEEGEEGRLKSRELALLANLKLALYQKKDGAELREKLQEIDKNVILFLRGQQEGAHYLSIDVPALRKLYGQILTHAHYRKYDEAIDLVSYLEHGFIYPDKGILAGRGYERFQVIRQALMTVHDLEKSQRQIMSAAFKKSMIQKLKIQKPMLENRSLPEKSKDQALRQDQKMQSWIMRQRALGDEINELGRDLVKSGVDASGLTVAAYDLMRDVVTSMQAGNLEEAAQYQSQILTVLQSLKKRLDREMQFASRQEEASPQMEAN